MADDLERGAVSPATDAAYRRAADDFAAWFRRRHSDPTLTGREVALAVVGLDLQADVAEYLEGLAGAGAALSTVRRARAAVDRAFGAEGLPPPSADPAVARRWGGLLRSYRGEAPPDVVRLAEAAAPALALLVAAVAGSPAGPRDRAALLLGAGAGLGAPELVGLVVGDVEVGEVGGPDPSGGPLRLSLPEGRAVTFAPAPGALSAADAVGRLLALYRAQGLGVAPPAPLLRPVDRNGRVRDRPLTRVDVGRLVRRAARAAGLPDAGSFGVPDLRALVAR